MKPDFEAIALDIQNRVELAPPSQGRDVRAMIAAQLALAYQEGICDGLRQSEAAIKAAFDKFQGRVEP